jgi:hypothetical protein
MRELEGEVVWGVSECCPKFRIDRDTVDESRDAGPVKEPAWHGDGVSPSAAAVVEAEGLAAGLIPVLLSARVLLLRGRMVACGTDTEGLTE